ncbi:MAG TPA: PAS domain S-box protein [Polyangia bacterium]|jgi:PAS domain S-box-containing protein|nr:PAS domain S-box protein [Polyangia bacterium]
MELGQVPASEERFRALLEAIPDAVVIAGIGGEIVYVNGQTERLFDYPRADLIGQAIEILIPERFRQMHPQHRAAFEAAPQVRPMGAKRELYGRRKDGTEVPIEVSLSPLQTEQGTLVVSSIRDISERKRADEARNQLAAIVASSGDAIIGKTLEGVITSWNDAASRIFGYDANEIVGQSITVLVPPERLDEEKEILAKLARGERIEQFDTVRRRKDGRHIDVSLTTSPVRDADGRLIGAAKIVRDITERRRAAGALAQARDLAEAASRELEAFSYSVAHDLRAPLRGMNGFARLLLDAYTDKLDAEGQDWLQEIVSNSQKMGDLIDALLGLARVTRSELKVETVDLSAIARDVILHWRLVEPQRHVETHVQSDLTAEVDPRLARALLDNLIGNAWKFTGQKPGARIEFGGHRAGDAMTFFIKDDGAGFDMAYADKLFAPFQRLHAATEFAGTGIGLATSQRIVRRHSGRIWAEGKVGGGATFYFTLPSRTGRLS